MAKVDQKNNLQPATGLSATLSGTTPSKGNIINMAGFDALTFAVQTGTVTDAGTASGFAFEVQESADTADANFTAVADADLLGLESALTVTDDAKDNTIIGSIGYIGSKQYVRIVATGTTGTAAGVECIALKGRADISPVSPIIAVDVAAT